MYCSTCGTPNAPEARFCGRCGTGLGVSAPPPPSPRPEASPVSAGGAATAPVVEAVPPSQSWQRPAQAVPMADPRMRGPAPGYAAPGGKVYATGKNPVVALILSFFIPGVGQLYNGDAKKGGIMLGILVLSAILTGAVIGFFGLLGVWVWSMIDAYNVATGKSPMM